MAGETITAQRAGVTVTVGDLEIEAIERMVVRVEQVGSGIVGLALKRPVSVIVRSPARTFRLDLEDNESADAGWSS